MNKALREKVFQMLEYWGYEIMSLDPIVAQYDVKQVHVGEFIEVYLYGVLDEVVDFSLRGLSEILSCQE